MPRHKEFAEMHATMKAWFDQQERDGWQSPEVHLWATHVLWSLWSCSQCKEVYPVQLKALAEYTAELERAKASVPVTTH